MFSFFKKKENRFVLGAPAKGKAVPLKEVSDPTFAEEMLGKGMAVIPSEGKIYAPADGEIGMVFDTIHAVRRVTMAMMGASAFSCRPSWRWRAILSPAFFSKVSAV